MKVLLNTPSNVSEFFEKNPSEIMSTNIASKFFFGDLTKSQMVKHQNIFRDVPDEQMQPILETSMQERRVDAIAKFCNVDRDTSRHYLEEHEYNPEPVIAEIDQTKR